MTKEGQRPGALSKVLVIDGLVRCCSGFAKGRVGEGFDEVKIVVCRRSGKSTSRCTRPDNTDRRAGM